ncbi:type I restriction enzyme HsdR N-terminal domain-containing protein [Aridibaculum aurantiacum]|uniref:type I restriction enzyme HsdR N-terminal domain-containing protein n=1 Tax=Aridibaculum aurantiacum TaxID=2810307 RepID=UPI001A9748CC|nr:type I restriction enzyme HsdR N-terminal domain-containing protein [Aridibaculum aurantiacum]
MINIQYPKFPFKIKNEASREVIFDECRKQWVTLTPEEWVRQNFLQYLVQVKQYPASLIAVEKEILVADVKKRFDVLVYKNAKPWMVVECKEMNVPLSEATIRQVLNYNIQLQVEYIVITNGSNTFAMQIKDGQHKWVEEMPEY